MLKLIIPSFITACNLACGVAAILSQDLKIGVLLITIAAVLDVLDGAAARMLDAKTEIGKQLDSLADIVSFCVAPSVLYFYAFENDQYTIMLFFASIVIAIGGALRLARFNIKSDEGFNYFEGLATPASGLFFAGLVLAQYYESELMLSLKSNSIYVFILALGIALLNVSTIKMFSLKQLSESFSVRIYFGILFITGMLLFFTIPLLALPILFVVYFALSFLDHFLIHSY